MKLPIEEWLDHERLSSETTDLLKEAVSCYKVSAYRAALLFSYLSFQNVIRDRILSSQRPTNIKSEKWDEMVVGLMDGGKWEGKVYSHIMANKDDVKVFTISDDLRRQVTYWKDRRNDCAHSKENEINNAHVESFWLFLQSNLHHFVVNGSRNALLREIVIHFDKDFTPRGSDPTSLVHELSRTIPELEVDTFLEEIGRKIEHNGFTFFDTDKDFISFLNTMFGYKSLILGVKNHLKKHSDDLLLLEFLGYYPEKVSYFHDDQRFIRKLWHRLLFRGESKVDLDIYCALLRNNLIPADEKEESIFRTIRVMTRGDMNKVENRLILNEVGFFSKFEEYVFLGTGGKPPLINSSFDWANKHSSAILEFLKAAPLTKGIVRQICRNFEDDDFFPYILRSNLEIFFENHIEVRERFINIANEHNYEIPSKLGVGV